MRVAVDFSGLKKIKWSEYAVRFVFDGTITAVTGVLAALYGPKFGCSSPSRRFSRRARHWLKNMSAGKELEFRKRCAAARRLR